MTPASPSGLIVLLACCALLLSCLPGTGALRCLSCKGCAKFEGSQAVQCSPSYDRCLKLHMSSGLVNRECGDEKMCQEKGNDRERHSAVHCCETNMCNGAPSGRTVFAAPVAGCLVAASASLRLLFF